jgi:hypothetical protein
MYTFNVKAGGTYSNYYALNGKYAYYRVFTDNPPTNEMPIKDGVEFQDY